eukprot:CAMPEP_0168186970 /NCGR_PEP_ID=MMETSP0139_2-20121125/14742_1 /TAXON_ID=44445 /ORGANISM="Pseudo-nitzschia australis, Strain 10249 10 AB" /LENGTH=45 /DNA_ID= /DNA_START= /DNA_END= /DNA_ORIENTATION=
MAYVLGHFVRVNGSDVSEGIGDGGAEVTDVNDGPFVGNGFDILCS